MHIDFLLHPGYTVQYLVAIFAVLYLLYRHRKDMFECLLILLFCDGVAAAISPQVQNIYKIVCLLLCVYMFLTSRRIMFTVAQKYTAYVVAFVLILLLFANSFLMYAENVPLTLLFSQISRYIEIFLVFCIIYYLVNNKRRNLELADVFFEIYLVQILLSILKVFTIRGITEGVSGTMAYSGGGIGTSGPIIGVIFYWVLCNGKFELKNWLYVAGLLFWGLMTAKRAVLIMFPVIVLALSAFVAGRKISKYVVIGIMAVPILFYLGVRLNPTLNPDKKYWGRFDWNYVFNYAETYQFGDDEHLEAVRGNKRQKGNLIYSQGRVQDRILFVEGRGATTLALLSHLFVERNLTTKDWWGWGLHTQYYSRGSYDYTSIDDLLVQPTHSGSATGIYQIYVAFGLIGIIAMIFFNFIPFFYFKNRRLGLLIAVFYFYDFFMYSGLISRTPALAATIFFVLHYTNYQINLQNQLRREYYANLRNNTGIQR